MSDEPVRTVVLTDEGELPFQRYFVARRFEPRVKGFRFQGAQEARPAAQFEKALQEADLVVLCPSNPWVSLDPILSIPGIREAVSEKPVYGVSPIIAGRAVKGPAAKMYRELGVEPSALAYARHYRDLLECVFIDRADAELEQHISALGVNVQVTDTLMKDVQGRQRVAEEILQFAEETIRKGVQA
jgi:LPPG:FO 2-phospho-L-lactate transferase